MNAAYEVTLGPAAIRMILRLPDPEYLANSLATELENGPNADKVLRFDGNAQVCIGDAAPGGENIYTATPLSFDAYTAIHRPMTGEELARLAEKLGRNVAGHGYYVVDILPAESAFLRKPRPL